MFYFIYISVVRADKMHADQVVVSKPKECPNFSPPIKRLSFSLLPSPQPRRPEASGVANCGETQPDISVRTTQV